MSLESRERGGGAGRPGQALSAPQWASLNLQRELGHHTPESHSVVSEAPPHMPCHLKHIMTSQQRLCCSLFASKENEVNVLLWRGA